MSGQYSIVSRNGRLRADSDDGEHLTLRIFPPHAQNAAEWETCVRVNLSDLRQIVGHFDWLTEGETPALDAEYERQKREFAERFADSILHLLELQRVVCRTSDEA